MSAALIVGVLIVGIVIGVPIAFSVLLSAVSGIVLGGVGQLSFIPSQMFNGVNSFTLMSLPMFSMMGEIMGQTDLGHKLVNIANSMVGWIKGGLGMAVVVVCMFFGTVSGSATAAVAALCGIMVPEMVKRGYPKALAAAIMSSAATLAIIVPPSGSLIIYGVIANTSISDLFLAAIIPGILSGGLLMVVVAYFARKLDLPSENKFSLKALLIAIKDGWAALLIPIVIFGGIFGGICTPTEAAAISVFVAVIGAIKELKWSMIPGILKRTAISTAIVTFLIATSLALSSVMTLTGTTQAIITLNLILKKDIQKMLPNKIIPVLTKFRIHCITKFCNCVTSLVTLVINEPVENLSVCSKENDITFLKQSFLISFPNLCPHRLANTHDKIPHIPPRTTAHII